MKKNASEADITSIFDNGLQAHNAGDLSTAEQLYQETLAIKPEHPEANHNIGVVLVAKNKLDKALQFFKFALDNSPSVSLFWVSYIDTLIKLERIGESKTLIKAVKKAGISCDRIEAISLQLNSLYQEPVAKDCQELDELIKQQQFDDAVKICLSLAETYPSSAVLNINLGKCYFELGQMEQAISSYKKATEYQPKWEIGFTLLGQIYSFQENVDQAIKAYKKAISLNPDCIDSHFNLGLTLRKQGNLEEAIEAYNNVMSIEPDNADAYNNRGNAFKEQGKLEEALEDYNKVLALKPDWADTHYNVGIALKEQGKLDGAIEAYNRALALKPDFADVYNNMGNALQEQGNLEEAIEAYNEALAIKPDDAEAYNNMGNALQGQGKLEEAIEAYNKALSITPDYAEAKHMLAALIGETTNGPPREYLENLFDKYAVRFESSLVGDLEYCIPRTLTDIILKQSSNRSLGSVLDLGCGTGLVGDEVKRFCENLEGIDLSKLMLEQTRLKNVYDKLTHSDIIEYLSNEELNFDYFISTDVFIYVGNLTEVFRFIKSRNKRPGKLTFSTEHTEKDGFQLQKTGRYTHSKSYIEGLCSEFKYTISHFSMSNLRKEKDQFLTGGLYVLDF